MPGMTVCPCRSITFELPPRCFWTAASLPTASMRVPDTANAVAQGAWLLPV